MAEVCVGKIVAAHGIKGEVKIKNFSESSDLFKKSINFYNDNLDRKFEFSIRSQKNDILIALVNNINNRNEAENLIGTHIYVMRQDLPIEEKDEFYIIDLIDMKLFLEDKTFIGNVINIHNFGAGDILEYNNLENKKEMLMFNNNYIINIDKNTREIIVKLPNYI